VKYLLLIYHNPGARELWESLPEDQRAEGLAAYAAFNQQLVADGELIAAEALADQATARRVSVQDGQPLTSDGPFAEAKEQLAGFYLVDCDSFERAADVASRIPEVAAGGGYVEVRPVMTYSGLEM
jgi:hypothetical protein